jgi:hypothetical protein
MSRDPGSLRRGQLFVTQVTRNSTTRRGTTHATSALERRVAAILRVPALAVLVLHEDLDTPGSPLHAVVENAEDLSAPDAGQYAALRQLDPPIDAVSYAYGFALPRTAGGKKHHTACRRLLAGEALPVVFTTRYGRERTGWDLQW